jgi:HK97 gp10 family phage protein
MSELIGKDKLFSRMNKIADKTTIAKAIDKASMRVLETARKDAPVDDGSLRASIHRVLEPSGLAATVGTPLDYAPFVEFGTGLYAVKGDGRKQPWSYQDENGDWHTTAGQQPQPFLEDALNKNIDKIKKDVAEIVKQEMKK